MVVVAKVMPTTPSRFFSVGESPSCRARSLSPAGCASAAGCAQPTATHVRVTIETVRTVQLIDVLVIIDQTDGGQRPGG